MRWLLLLFTQSSLSLWPCGLQHIRFPCPSILPRTSDGRRSPFMIQWKLTPSEQPTNWKQLCHRGSPTEVSSELHIRFKSESLAFWRRNKENIAKINKTKIWFFEKINKIDSVIARRFKKNKEKNQIHKIGTKMEKSQQTTQKTKDHKRLLSATVYKKKSQLGRNGQILKKV